jgi:DNA-binding GntR family transcriptional regulator
MIRSARSNAKTLTEAAQNEIRKAILAGRFAPGSQLPGEMELVSILGVSRTVVRDALRILEEDGLITRRQGSGTFVRKNAILNNLSLNFGATDMIVSAGMTPGTALTAVTVNAADDLTAEALSLEPGASVVTIERVRTADGRPVVYSLDALPLKLVADVDEWRRQAEQEPSLYAAMAKQLRLTVAYGVARILPVLAPKDIAARLQVAPGSPLLNILQTDFSSADEPILYSREYHLPDAFDFMLLRRGPVRLESAVPADEPSPPA